MHRSILAFGLAVGALALGACSTLGQPTTFDLVELTARCESRGGTLQPTGSQTGDARADNICQSPTVRPVPRSAHRSQLNQAVDRSLQRGY